MARELNYRAGEADSLAMTGLCYRDAGDVAKSLELLEGSARLFAALGHVHGRASALLSAAERRAARLGCRALGGRGVLTLSALPPLTQLFACLARRALVNGG